MTGAGRGLSGIFGVAALALLAGCDAPDSAESSVVDLTPASLPADTLQLHHVGLNTVDAQAAIDWYLRLWPEADRAEFDGKPAVVSDMHLIFTEVASAPAGAMDEALGRPLAQSPIWHIGAYANTTEMDQSLGAIGVEHLPLYTGVDDPPSVWRSNLAPYSGTRTAEALVDVEPAGPRAGGFSYVVAPDGALFEITGGPGTNPSLSHVHLFHEQPQCAANWYVVHLGMALPQVRGEDGSRTDRPLYDPCVAEAAEPGWPSLEPTGTIRGPRASVSHGNGSLSAYPRQCVGERCGGGQPLVPSRGQVLDHLGFTVEDVDAWHRWLSESGVTILEPPHPFGETSAFMIEGPDGIAIELVGRAGAIPLRPTPEPSGQPE